GCVASVQVTVPVPPTGGAVQLPFVVLTLAKFVPLGVASVIETLEAGSGPMFLTTIVYVIVPPVLTVPGAVLVTERSAEDTTLPTQASLSPPLQVPSVPHFFWNARLLTGKFVDRVVPVT